VKRKITVMMIGLSLSLHRLTRERLRLDADEF
jgi:hypothetical protein